MKPPEKKYCVTCESWWLMDLEGVVQHYFTTFVQAQVMNVSCPDCTYDAMRNKEAAMLHKDVNSN